MRRLVFSAIALFTAASAIASSGCGTPSDVGIAAYTQNLVLAKSSGPFGPALSGSVLVNVDAGSYSGSPLQVESISLELFAGSSTTQVLSRATFTTTNGITPPGTLTPGTSATFSYKIAIDQLTPDEATALCAGPISVGGAVTITGRAPSTIAGGAVNATGCP